MPPGPAPLAVHADAPFSSQFVQKALHSLRREGRQHLLELRQRCTRRSLQLHVLDQQRLVGLVVQPLLARVRAPGTKLRVQRRGQDEPSALASTQYFHSAHIGEAGQAILQMSWEFSLTLQALERQIVTCGEVAQGIFAQPLHKANERRIATPPSKVSRTWWGVVPPKLGNGLP